MFSKATKGSEPVETAAPRKLVVASLVAEGVRICGDISTTGDIHLDGAVEGDLSAGRLTIGETGSVTGSVKAEHVEIRGHVSGTISARVVCLRASARVDGDVSHAELSIEAGAHFEGRSLVFAEPAAAEESPALSVVAAE